MLKHMTKFTGLFILALFTLLTASVNAADSDVVAKVNDEEITVGEMENMITAMVQQSGQKIPPGKMNQVTRQNYETALGRLVGLQLLEDVAEKKDIEVSEDAVNQQIDQIKSQLPQPDMLEKQLQATGKTLEGLKADIRNQLRMQKVIATQVPDTEEVTEEEARAFFDENPDQFTGAEQVKASHILLKVNKDASDEEQAEAKKKLNDIRQKIVDGEMAFAEAAKQYSEGPSAEQGGDLGYFEQGRMVKEFADKAFSMEVGEISEPVLTQFGYHIIKVTDTKKSYDDFKDDILSYLQQQKQSEATQNYVNKLKEQADIEVMIDEQQWEKMHPVNSAPAGGNQPIQIPKNQLKQQ